MELNRKKLSIEKQKSKWNKKRRSMGRRNHSIEGSEVY